jgi:integrase
MLIKFNARSVGRLKPAARRLEYHDAVVPGLSLRITPNGVKSWTALYRHRGRLRRLTLGDATAIPLAEARTRAKDAIRDASNGADPAADKQAHRQAETIADLVADYLEKHAKRKKRSWREDARILTTYVLPTWKHRAIADIRRRDVRDLLDPIAERAPVMANRALACVRKMLAFAVDREWIEANPAARMARPGAEHARTRVLSDEEIRQLWASWSRLPSAMAAFYQLRLVTAQRGGEVASMRWRDVDVAAGWWTIPSERSKNTLPHRVPSTPMAITILSALQGEAQDAPDRYVLDGARGRRQHSEAAASFPVPDFRGHDLRRTAASLMAGGGVPRLTISKILNHVETGVTAIYDRHSYDAEKLAALTWWAAKLTVILEQRDRRAVLPFARP